MSDMSEANTRAKLIDLAIHARGWTEDLIKCEESAGAVEIVAGKARRKSNGRTDYTLRVLVNPETQPVALALLEAKKESLAPGHGLDQAKGNARSSQHNVQFVFSSNDDTIKEAETQVAALLKEAHEATGKVEVIESAVYDLKAVNPNRKANVDTRTPDELLDLIEAKGREIADALALLWQSRSVSLRGKAVRKT